MSQRVRRSEERVPNEFRLIASEVRRIALILNDYLRESDLDAPGRPLADDLAIESTFADDQLLDPVVHVCVRGHHSLIAAADHLLGVAACVEAQNIALAPMSLLRPIVTAAGMAFFTFEADISIRERLRRGINFELESVREQLNSIDKKSNPGDWERAAQRRHRYLVWGEDHGYAKNVGKGYGQKTYWLADGESADASPSDMKLAKQVLASVGDGDLGPAVYRFTSAFIHTQAHSFSMFLPADMQYDPQTPNVVPLGLAAEDLATWLMVAVMSVHLAVARAGAYLGWDMDAWTQTVRAIMQRWEGLLRN